MFRVPRLFVFLITLCFTLTAGADEPKDQPKKESDPARYSLRLEAAKLISDPAKKSKLLLAIAADAAEDGLGEEVKKCLAELPDKGNAAEVGKVLLKLAGRGKAAEALDAAKTIEDKAARDVVLEQLASGPPAGSPASLWRACEKGNETQVRDIFYSKLSASKELYAGVLNAKDPRGETALMKASARGHVSIVKYLLAKEGVEVWETDSKGQTALIHAAEAGQDAVVRLLLQRYDGTGSPLFRYPRDNPADHADATGQTAFMKAAAKGHLGVVTYLSKAQRTTTNDDMYLTWSGGGTRILENLKDKQGKTALDLARENNHKGVVEFLEQKK